MIRMVRGGTGASSRLRAFPATVQRLLRCDILRRTREIQRGHRRSCPSSRAAIEVGPETALECVRRAILGILDADDGCMVS